MWRTLEGRWPWQRLLITSAAFIPPEPDSEAIILTDYSHMRTIGAPTRLPRPPP